MWMNLPAVKLPKKKPKQDIGLNELRLLGLYKYDKFVYAFHEDEQYKLWHPTDVGLV